MAETALEQPEPTPTEQFEAAYDVGADEPSAPTQIPQSPEAAETPSSPPIKHPAYLANMARKSGFSDEEIASIPTEHLGLMIERIQERTRELAEQNRTLPRQQEQPRQVAVPLPEEDVDLRAMGIVEEDYAPEFVKAMKAIVKAPLKKVKELEAKLVQSEQQREAQTQQETNRQIDKLFAELGPEYSTIFGKGNVAQVRERNPQAFAERMAVVRRMNPLLTEEGMTLAEAHAEVVKFRYPDVAKKAKAPAAPAPEPEDAEIEQRKKDWEEGAVAKPTQRKQVAQPDGKQKAIDNVSKLLQQRRAPEQTNAQSNGHATKDDFLE